jgi:dipeptidyl aminopeptidase/acylaminoacyl peptidase
MDDFIQKMRDNNVFQLQSLGKAIDDVLWHQFLGNKAKIDKWRIIGPAPANTNAQSDQDKGNPFVLWIYTFIPKNLNSDEKRPLMVYIHGGVHASIATRDYHIIEELLDQGYIVVAPEYRGSTGYGEKYYKLIDYGGLETEDTFAARNWAVENLPNIDTERVGIMGWSHGGLHTLFNIFNHPESYTAAYAGVPVSDLVARMGYKGEFYHSLYSAEYHIGKSAVQSPEEYKKRSPAWHAHKLQTPLRIHTTTSDEDVNVLEVEHLIKSLKAEGKEFEYEIYDNAPGGHVFDRIDTKDAREIRYKAYEFLAKHLSPPFTLK